MATRAKEIKGIIENTVIKYSKIKTVNAYNIIPHFPEYYMEDLLHPNSLGMAVYGYHLAKKIKEL
jgi:lysophospholipase L1-like esterase